MSSERWGSSMYEDGHGKVYKDHRWPFQWTAGILRLSPFYLRAEAGSESKFSLPNRSSCNCLYISIIYRSFVCDRQGIMMLWNFHMTYTHFLLLKIEWFLESLVLSGQFCRWQDCYPLTKILCNPPQRCQYRHISVFPIEARSAGWSTFRCFVLCCSPCSGYYQIASAIIISWYFDLQFHSELFVIWR